MAPRRPRALRIVPDEPMWMPREGVPAGGRDECRHGERPCPYVKCEFHLWLVDGRDRRGRFTGSNREGFTAGRLGTTLMPRWLEYPTPPCCALDIIEAVDSSHMTAAAIALALGMTEDGVLRIIKRALGRMHVLKEHVEL